MTTKTFKCDECGASDRINCPENCPRAIGACNAACVWDQRHEFGGLRGSIKAYRQNVIDTAREQGVLHIEKALKSFYAELREDAERRAIAKQARRERQTYLISVRYAEGGENVFRVTGGTAARHDAASFAGQDGVRSVDVYLIDGDLVDVTDRFVRREDFKFAGVEAR